MLINGMTSTMQDEQRAGETNKSGDAAASLLLAWEKLNSGSPDEARALFKLAVVQADIEYGEDNIAKSDIYTDAATGLFLLGPENYDPATRLLQSALRIRTAADGECHADCA